MDKAEIDMVMRRLKVPWDFLTVDERDRYRRLAKFVRMQQMMRVNVEDEQYRTVVVWARRGDVADLFDVPSGQDEAMDVCLCSLSEAGGIAAQHLAEAYRP